MKNVNKFNLS